MSDKIKNPPITLTTDFGLNDTYVGQIKGAILSRAPYARIVDLSHDVPPQDILTGAFMLEAVLGVFPRRSVHVCVVDPGVGTERRALAIETEDYFWVGPDNGVFSLIMQRQSIRKCVELTNPAYHRVLVSPTFAGRDIFAPVAAHLASGTAMETLGKPVDDLVTLDIPQPTDTAHGTDLHILRVDRFGNLITDLTHLVAAASTLEIAGQTIIGINTTFGDVPPGEPVAYFGSTGRLEIAIHNGHAANIFQVKRGDRIHLKP